MVTVNFISRYSGTWFACMKHHTSLAICLITHTWLGFHRNPDPCVSMKVVAEECIRISVYADDILITCLRQQYRDWFESSLEEHYRLVKQHDEVFYLGMVVSRKKIGDVRRINLNSFINFKLPRTQKGSSYSNGNGFLRDWMKQRNQNKHLSFIMQLMFIASCTRLDVLFHVSYLATRCLKLWMTDWKRAMRILCYLSVKKFEKHDA